MIIKAVEKCVRERDYRALPLSLKNEGFLRDITLGRVSNFNPLRV
jgi:hypothetical protein